MSEAARSSAAPVTDLHLSGRGLEVVLARLADHRHARSPPWRSSPPRRGDHLAGRTRPTRRLRGRCVDGDALRRCASYYGSCGHVRRRANRRRVLKVFHPAPHPVQCPLAVVGDVGHAAVDAASAAFGAWGSPGPAVEFPPTGRRRAAYARDPDDETSRTTSPRLTQYPVTTLVLRLFSMNPSCASTRWAPPGDRTSRA